MAKILVIHGPNLNLLGTREPDIYGKLDLATINKEITEIAEELGHQATCFQSNSEHEIVDIIHNAANKIDFIIINAGAYSHTSIAIRDALCAVDIHFIEVHLSNIYAREPFRQHSYLSDIASGVIVGMGPLGYQLAMVAANQILA